MKYQIYLNKETSQIVELIAKSLNKKPATAIKDYLEEVFSAGLKIIGEDNSKLITKGVNTNECEQHKKQ